MVLLSKTIDYQKMCDTNKNVTKMGMIINGVYCMFFSGPFWMKPCKLEMNQSTQKGRIQGTKWKDPNVQEDQKNQTTYEGKPQREHQISEPLHVMRSISNKEKRGPLERTPSLKEPSSTATIHLTKTIFFFICIRCNATDTLYL
jgi:hypothetical protein